MTQILKQSTAVDVLIGPFLDKTDALTAETGESPSVKLSKNGQALGAKNDATTPVHDADGYHNCELDATDTDTVGTLVLTVVGSANALPVRHEFQVLDTEAYDFLYADAAAPVDLIWDEVLTGGTHNVTNSSGRRIRIIQESGSYALGHVYIDTVNGTTGTDNFENGVDILPAKNIGDANTLATSVGLSRFSLSPNSSITFAAAQENQEFHGENWTLALGGRAVGGSHFDGAEVSGIGTCASEAHFEHCELGTMTIGIAHFDECDIEGTVTLSGAGTYRFFSCMHSGSAVIDFGTEMGVNMTVHIHGYNGALTIENLGNSGTDVLHFDSSGGQLTLAASCVGGTLNFRGTAALVNNGSGMTINRGGDVVNDVSTILTTQMTEAYAANGVAPTLAQATFAMHQILMQFGISGTSLTVRKLDNSATAFVVTLDDATSPTDAKRV